MEQGRLATAHIFGAPFKDEGGLFPYGIYTIPEIAMIGQTEEQLTAQKIPYETGVARYEEIAKAEMLGDGTGMLKLLFYPETRKLLGIHVIGQRATENHSHWPDRSSFWRHRRVFPRCRVQLSHLGRGLQGGSPERSE